jgi:hypothetical protein
MPLTYEDRRRVKEEISRRALERVRRGRHSNHDSYIQLALTEAGGDPLSALNTLLDVRCRGELPARTSLRRDRPKGT